MKIDINPGSLDREILSWYDTASVSEITNAVYHGYKIVSNPDFNRCIDNSSVSKLECENSMLIEELNTYKTRAERIRNETEIECRASMQEKCVLLDERLLELKQDKSDIYTNLNLLLEEKEKRIGDMKRIADIHEEKIKALNSKNSDLVIEVGKMNGILNNSYKKGEFAENKLEDIFNSKVDHIFDVNNVGSKESHCGDIHLTMKNSDAMILVESKFYSTGSKHMIKGEVTKFLSDIDSCKDNMDVASAIFISISCDIPNITTDFACREEKGIRCYYLANMTDEKCKLLVSILEIEERLYKEKAMAEGNESMNKFLMRNFIEISNNYKKIEELSPGYEEIRKVIDRESKKFNKKISGILEEISIISECFKKVSMIDTVGLKDVSVVLDIDSPHSLNMDQWDTFKNEHVRLGIENKDLAIMRSDVERLNSELLEAKSTAKSQAKSQAKSTAKSQAKSTAKSQAKSTAKSKSV